MATAAMEVKLLLTCMRNSLNRARLMLLFCYLRNVCHKQAKASIGLMNVMVRFRRTLDLGLCHGSFSPDSGSWPPPPVSCQRGLE